MIVSLDQSLSNTGFAKWRPGEGSIESGALPLCGGVPERRHGFLELWRLLDAWHKSEAITAICHEEPISGPADKTPTRIALFGLVAIVELFSVSRSIPVFGYDSRNWRGTFFSKEERAFASGERWKRLAVERCRQLGFDPATHDEAEAIGILDHHLHRMKVAPPWREANPFLPVLG